jgi:hypothetical protein
MIVGNSVLKIGSEKIVAVVSTVTTKTKNPRTISVAGVFLSVQSSKLLYALQALV